MEEEIVFVLGVGKVMLLPDSW